MRLSSAAKSMVIKTHSLEQNEADFSLCLRRMADGSTEFKVNKFQIRTCVAASKAA